MSNESMYNFTVAYFRQRYSLPPFDPDHFVVKTTAPPYVDLHEDQLIQFTTQLGQLAPTSKLPKAESAPGKVLMSPYDEGELFEITPDPDNPLPPVTAAPCPDTNEPFCSPLLLQVPGRSKTIIGIEPFPESLYHILALDPYSPRTKPTTPWPSKRAIRHPPSRITILGPVVCAPVSLSLYSSFSLCLYPTSVFLYIVRTPLH